MLIVVVAHVVHVLQHTHEHTNESGRWHLQRRVMSGGAHNEKVSPRNGDLQRMEESWCAQIDTPSEPHKPGPPVRIVDTTCTLLLHCKCQCRHVVDAPHVAPSHKPVRSPQCRTALFYHPARRATADCSLHPHVAQWLDGQPPHFLLAKRGAGAGADWMGASTSVAVGPGAGAGVMGSGHVSLLHVRA